MATTSYTILVNSSDGFEDCWGPFFELFSRYWPDCAAPVLLNTERKDWSFPKLNLQCSRVQEKSGIEHRLTWSECLLAAIQQIDSPLILYFQEDYFLEGPVKCNLIEELALKMVRQPEIRHIGLTHFGSCGPFSATNDPKLWKIGRNARYRISTQAGLWRTDTLRDYLCPIENGWMFEILGTLRARRRDDLFLTLNRDAFSDKSSRVIDYLHTGIIKGQWHPAIPEVFARNGISVDFQRRGFHKRKPWLLAKGEVLQKLAAHPVHVLKQLLP